MDKQVQKIKFLADEFIGRSVEDVIMYMGTPDKGSCSLQLFYTRNQKYFLSEVVTFIFFHNRLTDIAIIQYFMGIELSLVSFDDLVASKLLKNEKQYS